MNVQKLLQAVCELVPDHSVCVQPVAWRYVLTSGVVSEPSVHWEVFANIGIGGIHVSAPTAELALESFRLELAKVRAKRHNTPSASMRSVYAIDSEEDE